MDRYNVAHAFKGHRMGACGDICRRSYLRYGLADIVIVGTARLGVGYGT